MLVACLCKTRRLCKWSFIFKNTEKLEDENLMAVFWDTLMTEAVGSSETSVSIYQTERCKIPEDNFQPRYREEIVKLI
jgi:hypothetical protein